MTRPLLYDCPRFSACNAPVCPLWPESLEGPHRRGDDVCRYLMEAVKSSGAEVLRGSLSTPLAEAVLAAVPVAMSLGGDLSRRLRRAEKHGSQIDSIARARASRAVQVTP